MPYSMRKSARQISAGRAEELLSGCSYGILSLMGEEDGKLKPYGVPISPVLLDGSLYFHCGFEGRKIDCIKQYPAASFCAVGMASFGDEGDSVTMYYESVIASGNVEIVTDEAEKERALCALTDKFLNDAPRSAGLAASGRDFTNVLRMTIENITGKKRAPEK